MARPGRWYFGWNIVAAASSLTLLTTGLRMSIGPFFLPIAQDLGFSRSLLAAIVAVGMLCYGLGMPIAGQLVGSRGARFVVLLGLVLILAALGGSVAATGPIGFLLSFGIVLSIGLAFISPVTFTPMIARWFVRQRGAALFFLSTGSMAGIAILTPAMGYFIQEWVGEPPCLATVQCSSWSPCLSLCGSCARMPLMVRTLCRHSRASRLRRPPPRPRHSCASVMRCRACRSGRWRLACSPVATA